MYLFLSLVLFFGLKENLIYHEAQMNKNQEAITG